MPLPLDGLPLPLAGLLVVSCEQAGAAPFATRQLADLGARVIKIERAEGDFARDYDRTVHGQSSHFIWLNRGKQSVVLDLKCGADLAVLLRLLDGADVFVQNLAPGAADRLGLAPEVLRERNPRLITCSISGYGDNGPYRDAKAYDLLVQSEAGLVAVTGTAEEPAKAGIPAADIGAGMYAFAGILSALYERERTGLGSDVRTNLFDALVEWMGYPLLYAGYGGTAPARAGTSHAAIAPYGSFAAGDGTEVVLSVQNQREWGRFCADVLGDAAVATDPRFADGAGRVANRPALQSLIDATFATLTGEEVERRLTAAGIAHARRRTVAEVLTHPQLAARDRWREIGTPRGPVNVTLPPLSLGGHTLAMGDVPALGQHTEQIRAEVAARPDAGN